MPPTTLARTARSLGPAALLALTALAAGCSGGLASQRAQTPERGLAHTGVAAPEDVMVRGARLLPQELDEAHVWSEAPGGGQRATVGAERVISWPDGTITGAVDRLPALASQVVEVPERMGGGFLFAMGPHLWRSDTWLGRARPLAVLPANVSQLQVGLDRLYARVQGGGLVAMAPQTGALVGLGPLPATPALGRMAALDAWRAVAIADLRGVLLTLDAGATWRPLALPIDAADVVLLDDGIAIGGTDERRQTQWWEVRPDGQFGRLPSAPAAAGGPESASTLDSAARVFGDRPLATAVADGWPLTDGTALVARDGSLGRIRIADGALVETVPDAFPLKPARCHPVTLARPAEPGAFGFVCGEPRGRTVVYRYVAAQGRLVEMRRFDGPREVLAFGNGALASPGPCAADGRAAPDGDDRPLCVMAPGAAWREIQFRGEDVERARPVVLHDGRVVLVRPPRADDLSTVRLTITDGVRSSHVPAQMPSMGADVSHALRVGLWMDGFEERRDGVVGGWVDAGGSVVGLEIAIDGAVKVGKYIRAASDVFVSGRWGLGWTASRRGLETVDGGMTWKDFDVPDPIAPARAPHERACGPVGCLAAGWIRVGWGEPERPPPEESHASRTSRPYQGPPRLTLDCTPRSGKPPEPKRAPPRKTPPGPRSAGIPARSTPWSTVSLGSGPPGSTDPPPFAARPPPALGPEDSGAWVELSAWVDRSLRPGPSGMIYAWGPKGGDWDQLGRWSISWVSPYAAWPETRSTSVAAAPWTSLDGARRALQSSGGWSLAGGDDPDHALLIQRNAGPGGLFSVLALEADRAPFEVRRSSGEAFPEIEAAERINGRWYLATQQAPGELAATVVWLLDGGQSRELARVPRTALEGARATAEGRAPVRLARRADGRALGLVVDALSDLQGVQPMRWVVSVELESGVLGEPEPLAPLDLSDRAVRLCTGDDSGWELEAPFPGQVVFSASVKTGLLLNAPRAWMRLSRERACIERLSGTLAWPGAGASPQADRAGVLARFVGSGAPLVAPGARAVNLRFTAPGLRAPASARCSLE